MKITAQRENLSRPRALQYSPLRGARFTEETSVGSRTSEMEQMEQMEQQKMSQPRKMEELPREQLFLLFHLFHPENFSSAVRLLRRLKTSPTCSIHTLQ